MKLLDLIIKLKEENKLSKILIFNDLTLTKNEFIEISNYFQSVYISFYNNFATRNLHIQLRYYKNINVVEPNSIPNINYDVICAPELTKPILFILSIIKHIKYFYCTNSNIDLDVEIPGFKKDPTIKNLYVKDSLTLSINENNEDGSFNENLRKLNDFKSESLNKNIVKNEKVNINKKVSNNIVIVKNIVSSLNKFSNFKEVSNINNGEMDICCFLTNKKDFDLFLKVIKYLNENYSYTKYFIFLNGKTILKYFKEEEFKNLNYILIKSKEEEFKNTYSSIFELLANGSYKFYMNEINFNAEIIDLL